MNNKKEIIGIIVSLVIVVGFIGFISLVLIKKVDKIDEISPSKEIIENKTEEIYINETQKEDSIKPEIQMDNNQKISKKGDTLVMNYTGRLTDGTVFDSNVDPKFNHVQPFEFVLGAGMVIQGWDEGLLGMKIGEKKTLTISPEKGYGDRGVPGAIPGGATLIFDVELVDIK